MGSQEAMVNKLSLRPTEGAVRQQLLKSHPATKEDPQGAAPLIAAHSPIEPHNKVKVIKIGVCNSLFPIEASQLRGKGERMIGSSRETPPPTLINKSLSVLDIPAR